MGVIKPILPPLIQGAGFGVMKLYKPAHFLPSPLWLGRVCSTGLSRANRGATEHPRVERTHEDHRVQHLEALAGESERNVTHMKVLGLEGGSWVKGDSSSDTSQNSRDDLRLWEAALKNARKTACLKRKKKEKKKEKNKSLRNSEVQLKVLFSLAQWWRKIVVRNTSI